MRRSWTADAFEEHAFAAWRADETYTWVLAAKAGEEALRAVTDDADAALVGEIGVIVVRAYGKMQQADDLDRAAREVGQLLESRGADAGARAMVHVRHGDGLLGMGRGREAADAYAAAADLFGPGDPRIAWLRLSLCCPLHADFDARADRSRPVDSSGRARQSARSPSSPRPAHLGLPRARGHVDEAERRLRAHWPFANSRTTRSGAGSRFQLAAPGPPRARTTPAPRSTCSRSSPRH